MKPEHNKIHKNPIAVRPIVSGCGGPTERISTLVDLHLQPHVPLANSYLRDSSQLLQLLEDKTFPTDVTLATIDVKALYINIPHGEGTRAVLNRLYHNNPNSQAVEMPPETLADLLKIVLTHNYFQFADRMYHQVQGTAMGTKMAPAYAEHSREHNHHTTPLEEVHRQHPVYLARLPWKPKDICRPEVTQHVTPQLPVKYPAHDNVSGWLLGV